MSVGDLVEQPAQIFFYSFGSRQKQYLNQVNINVDNGALACKPRGFLPPVGLSNWNIQPNPPKSKYLSVPRAHPVFPK